MKDVIKNNSQLTERETEYDALYMRKLFLYFPKSVTLSHLLTWSHYYEYAKRLYEVYNQEDAIRHQVGDELDMPADFGRVV